MSGAAAPSVRAQGPGPAPLGPDGLVTLDEVHAAADRLLGILIRTPLLPCPALSERTGHEVRLKCESLQRSGSFKARGANDERGTQVMLTVRDGILLIRKA